jgi:metal-dependent hydrolase (beta-lactamase superfamily II)
MGVFFLWVVVGALVGAAATSLTRRAAARRSERFANYEGRAWALFLLLAALIYVGFAAFNGADARWTKVEVGGLVGFGLVAAIGWHWAVLVGVGWLAHASWDVFVHPGGLPGYVPFWYPPLCLGFDVFVGSFLITRFTALGWKRTLAAGVGVLTLLPSLAVIGWDLRVQRGVARAEEAFAETIPRKLGDIGTTKTLTVLPLIDWHTSDPALQTEMGVSYLVSTDTQHVIFDVGHNAKQISPSPLQQNMAALDLDVDDFDTVFISHNHFDHVGGKRAIDEGTFMIGPDHVPLPGKRAFAPVPLSYPGLEPVVGNQPTVVGRGLASTGTIPRQLAFGWIDEQALAVNVEGHGVVLIVGCGHQTIPKLLERYDDLFDEPLYGIIGGLHYPVPGGRLQILGMNAQRRFASGRGILDPLDMEDVEIELEMLKARNLGLVGLSGHDSSEEVIAMFRDAFGDAYRNVRVGERITLPATN